MKIKIFRWNYSYINFGMLLVSDLSIIEAMGGAFPRMVGESTTDLRQTAY